MKIRFQAGSLRFRLGQDDARALIGSGRLEERIAIGETPLGIVLELHDQAAHARMEWPRIIVGIPVTDAHRWASGGEVGLYYALTGETRLIIEKDWACLVPSESDKSTDRFPRAD